MDKLIRLINEYGHTSNCGPFQTYRIEPATEWRSSYLVLSRDDNGEGDWKDWHLEVPRLISKEYGFIGWLVEKDKVNAKKIDEDRLETIQYSDKERITIYDWLLMLLSISNSPIDDLINYLK